MVRCPDCRTFVRTSGMADHRELFHKEPEAEVEAGIEELQELDVDVVEDTAQDAHERAMSEFIAENAEFEQRINSEPNATSSPAPRRKNSKRKLETEFIDDAATDPVASISKKSKDTHTCTLCNKDFARKDTLKRHLKTMHK